MNYNYKLIAIFWEFMAVFVDSAEIEWNGKKWCHLVADSLDELHTFARLLGLKRSWFQGEASSPHYDITVVIREKALALGAVQVSSEQLVLHARRIKKEREYAKTQQRNNDTLLFISLFNLRLI